MSDDASKESPWVCHGYTEEHEDELIGNREGFQILKKRIDDVLETGRVTIQEADIEWIGLKLVADDPRERKNECEVNDLIAVLVVGACVAFGLFVFIIGLITIWSWWNNCTLTDDHNSLSQN